MLKLATKFLPEADAFQAAVEAGFEYAEFFLNAKLLNNVDELICLSRAYPLKYALHFPNRPELSDLQLRECVRLYQSLDCRAMVIHPPMFDRYAPALKALDPNLVLAVENQRVAPAEFVDWVGARDYVTLDVEHLWKFSLQDAPLEEVVTLAHDVFERHRDRIRHVHMPGYLPGHAEHRPMYTSREFVMAMLSLLQAFDFEGFIVSEVDTEFQNPHELHMDRLLFDLWAHSCPKQESAAENIRV